MLKKHPRVFEFLQVVRDAVTVALAFTLAYALRFSNVLPTTAATSADPRETMWVGCFALSTWISLGYLGRLYVSHRARGLVTEMFLVFRTTLYSFFVVVTLTYFMRDVRYSRVVLGLWVIFSFTGVASIRLTSRLLLRRIRSKGYNLRHVLVIGTGALAADVIHMVHRHPSLGFRVRGALREHLGPRRRATDEMTNVHAQSIAGVPVLGELGELSQVVQREGIDQVLVALGLEQLAAMPTIMEEMSLLTVDVRLVPDIHQHATLCGSIEDFGGIPVINLQDTPQVGWNRLVKRFFDFSLALVGAVAFSPILALIAALIKLGSKGPVFFSQERVGFDGHTFTMFKFRTMALDAESSGAQMAVAADPRCTPLGALLRRLSLDELPQLWNVLLGDMSLVGPRPERPCFVEELKREIPRYALRHKMKAGMTGWAQVHGMRGNTSIEKRVELDLYYIENWSMTLYMKIIVRTVFGGFLSPNAY